MRNYSMRFGLAIWFAFLTAAAFPKSIVGVWDATVTVNNVDIPFRLELSGKGSEVQSYFFNGNDKVNPSTSGNFHDGLLVLHFDSYATRLEARLDNGTLSGTYVAGLHSSYPFHAKRHSASVKTASYGEIPNIDGLWEIQVKSPKGESAWHFIVNQSGSTVLASILRIDGDTGTLSGKYENGKFMLSHFTGERPVYAEVIPQSDGTLQIHLVGTRDKQDLVALRPESARAKGQAPPDDPTQHTKLKNPDEPLRFSFPDLNGHIVSNADARFRGRVVLVDITGSWCPNCHDEAPFLEELYRKYHSQGLEIVALDFEQSDQLKDLSRLHAFIKRYEIDYIYLIAGEPDQLNEKLPQAENLTAWPTTFFIGRDGLVRAIHTGFTSRASGSFDLHLKDQITSDVAHLLSESAPAVATVGQGTNKSSEIP